MQSKEDTKAQKIREELMKKKREQKQHFLE